MRGIAFDTAVRCASQHAASPAPTPFHQLHSPPVIHIHRTCEGRHEVKYTTDWGGNTILIKAAAFGCRKTVSALIRTLDVNGRHSCVLEHKNTNKETAETLASMNGHEFCANLIRDPTKLLVADTRANETKALERLAALADDDHDGTPHRPAASPPDRPTSAAPRHHHPSTCSPPQPTGGPNRGRLARRRSRCSTCIGSSTRTARANWARRRCTKRWKCWA